MPIRNGSAALTHITAMFNEDGMTWKCPLVAVTGNADSKDAIDMLQEAGAVSVLGKPTSMARIQEELRRCGLL